MAVFLTRKRRKEERWCLPCVDPGFVTACFCKTGQITGLESLRCRNWYDIKGLDSPAAPTLHPLPSFLLLSPLELSQPLAPQKTWAGSEATKDLGVFKEQADTYCSLPQLPHGSEVAVPPSHLGLKVDLDCPP